MASVIAKDCLDQIFLEARTHNKWLDKPVSEETLHRLVDLMKMGPTSANISPARILFLRSIEAKKRLEPHLSQGNRAKTMSAPVCAIIGYDLKFYEHLPKLFPHNLEARSWFVDRGEEHIESSAFRNGSLQGAYFIIAARALGLDTGPMSGFDNAGVDREFFSGTAVKSNFICSLGHGDPAGLFPRSPRFTFEEMAQIL
jgi:3-hydroxypropanoate dehydrogenase